jgi:NAD/NADP transhydrogenase beta subunit
VLTIVGALIGSSGAFLTKIMCDGMNRSLANVILGGFGTEAGAVQTAEGLIHKEIDVDGATEAMCDAGKICIVPGYGMVVAQCQHTVAQIATKLAKQGKDVKFAVHPVAGRMPGQLNVLLAEVCWHRRVTLCAFAPCRIDCFVTLTARFRRRLVCRTTWSSRWRR